MNDYLIVLAFAALPALGNFAGGVLAELFQTSQRMLNLALHLAAGIVIAVVAVELIPQSFDTEPQWTIILSFVAGAVFFIAVDWGVGKLQSRAGGDEASTGPWIIFIGVAIDLFSDGVMIGTGSTIAVSLGLLLALGQVPADIPEGFATIANFRRAGVERRKRLLLAAAFAIPIFLGATLGYWGVRGQPEIVKYLLLTFTAGVLTTLVIEEMVPEAHEEAVDSHLAPLAFAGGFALFALISAYLDVG